MGSKARKRQANYTITVPVRIMFTEDVMKVNVSGWPKKAVKELAEELERAGTVDLRDWKMWVGKAEVKES